jgi:capsular polysaccharide biosynthesis protein
VEIGTLIQLITKRLWLIILVAVLTAAAAYVLSSAQATMYKSTAKLIILSRPDFGQTQATKELLRTFAARFNSTIQMQEVINDLQLDMTPGSLLSLVTVAPATDSNVIIVEVENANPELAQQISRTLSMNFIQWRDMDNQNFRQEDRIRAELLDEPQLQEQGSVKINTLAGFVMGLALGIMLIAALELLDARFIRNEQEVSQMLGISIIGAIPPPDNRSHV